MTLRVYMANLDSRGIVGTIYVEDHQTLLYTKYISCGPHGYRKDFFKVFSIICLRVIDPHGQASLDSGGIDWQDLCWEALDERGMDQRDLCKDR